MMLFYLTYIYIDFQSSINMAKVPPKISEPSLNISSPTKTKMSTKRILIYLKNALLLISFVWLMIFMRHIQIRPEYQKREEALLTNGIDEHRSSDLISIYMQTKILKKVLVYEKETSQSNSYGKFVTKDIGDCYQDSKNCIQLNFFTLLKHRPQLPASCPMLFKDQKPNAESSRILILHAPSRDPSIQAVMALVKSLHQFAGTECPYPLQTFILEKKHHLLMSSQSEVLLVVQQIIKVIKNVRGYERNRLSIFAYEQGAILLLKILQLIDPQLLLSIDKLIFINLMSPDLKIKMEQGWRYIESIKQNLLETKTQEDQRRILYLNQTKMLFINTWKYSLKPFSIAQSIEPFYKLLFTSQNGTPFIFSKAVYLDTRLIHGLNNLILPKNYFLYPSFTRKLALFALRQILEQRNENKGDKDFFESTEQLFYSNYFGSVYLDNERQDMIRECQEIRPVLKNNSRQQSIKKQWVLDDHMQLFFASKCIKIHVNFLKKQMKSQKLAILFTGSNRMEIYNNHLQVLNKRYNAKNQSKYIVETLADSDTQYFIINNFEVSKSSFQLIPIYAPFSNPIAPTKSKQTQSKILPQPQVPSLITVCPYHQRLLFPEQFSRRSLQKYVMASEFILPQKQFEEQFDCYIDINLYDIVPDVVLRYWSIQVNIIIFTFLCSYVNKNKLQNRYWVQLLINWVLTFLILLKYDDEQSNYLYVVNFLLLVLVILLEKVMEICLVLTRFPQQYVTPNYQKIMIAITILTSAIKFVFPQQMLEISPYKILLLSIIFLLNPFNIIFLFIKIYLNSQLIVFNHNKIESILLVALWIHTSLIEKDEAEENQSVETEQVGQISRRSKFRIEKSVGLAEYLLLCGVAIFIDGPMVFIEFFVNFYMITKSLKIYLKAIKVD